MDLSTYINFSVEFNLIGYPTLNLTDTTAYPVGAEDAQVYFKVKQPDCISQDTPLQAINLIATQLLRLKTTGGYMCGEYTVSMFIQQGSDVTTLVRTFTVNYETKTLNLVKDFDLFTPKLQYRDQTLYNDDNYNVTGDVIEWNAAIGEGGAIGTLTASTSIFDLKYGGVYYSTSYGITFGRTITYQHKNYPYLTLIEYYHAAINTIASQPASVADMLAAVNALHDKLVNSSPCSGEVNTSNYVYAQALYQNIVSALQSGQTDNLYILYQQFANLTSLSNTTVTNAGMPPFDPYNFSVNEYDYSFDVVGTITDFTVPAFIGKSVLSVLVDGIGRKVTEGADTDVPAAGTFIFVKATGKLKYGGDLLQDTWVYIKYK